MTLASPAPSAGTAPAQDPPAVHRARPLLAELRRGSGPWTGLLIALSIVAMMVGKAADWQGNWAETTSMARLAATMVCGPLAVAAGCWQGGRERRRRTSELFATAVRPPRQQALLGLWPIALWSLLGNFAGLAVCFALTWPYAGYGHPYWSLHAADLVILPAFATVGFLAGRLSPWRLTAPLLGAITYVVIAMPTYAQDGRRWLSPSLDHGFDWDQPMWWLGPLSACWIGGIAATLLLATYARHRALLVLPLALAVASGTLLYQHGDESWRPDPASKALVCEENVCVRAVHSNLLDDMLGYVRKLNAKLEGVPNAPKRYLEGEDHQARPGDVMFSLDTDIQRGKVNRPDRTFFSPLRDASGGQCTHQENPAAHEFQASVMKWLDPSIGAYFEEPKHYQRLRDMPEAERTAWLGGYYEAVSDNCDFSEVKAP